MRESKIIKEDIKEISKNLGDIAKQLAGQTLLIAGGAGFLGKYIVSTLDYLNKNVLSSPCKIIVLDNFISGLKDSFPEDKNIEIIQQDISKPFKIEGKVDYILHAASIASPVFYNKFRLETIDVGFLGTRNLLEIAKEKNVKSFLFFSSSEVYGNPDPKFIPTPEEYLGNVSCTGPRACYDEPKRIGETLCMAYGEIFNTPVKIVRPFNIFGPGMRLDDGRVVSNFVIAALKGEKIPVYGGGSNTRTFCYISDAIVGFFQVLLSNHNREVFNIGSDEHEIQMRHLADLVHGLIDNDEATIQDTEGPSAVYSMKADPNRRCPDLTKIRTIVGYRPKVSLIKGVKRFITWAKEEMNYQTDPVKTDISCRVCGNKNLVKFLSLGKTPLANNLVSRNDLNKEELYPLELLYCTSCNLCQLSYVVPPEKMFNHYVYVTSTTETFKEHFKNMAENLTTQFGLNNNSLVVDIGSNDGLLLKHFKNQGVNVIGVEPAVNIAVLARSSGVETISEYFNEKTVNEITRIKGKADIVTANNVFAHVNDIKDLTRNVKNLLKDGGVFCIEVQYLLDTIQKLTFDNIYHEHLSYFTVMSLREFFNKHDMEIFKVQHVSSHGGSIRVFVQKKFGKYPVDFSVTEFIENEKRGGLDKLETYEAFAKKVYEVKDKFKNFLNEIKKSGKKVIGYGAPAKATTFLNFCGVDSSLIECIIEDNVLKQGLFVPGVKIPIVSKENIRNKFPDYIGILAWNFADEILRKNENYRMQGTKFFVPLPEPRII